MNDFEPIKLKAVIAEEVGVPRNDGTVGSALYKVPVRLSAVPPAEWTAVFIQTWNRPPQYSTMHRPGIASVSGDKVILSGTTLEEVEQYHRTTLILAVEEANRRYSAHLAARIQRSKQETERVRQHEEYVQQKAKEIRFQ